MSSATPTITPTRRPQGGVVGVVLLLVVVRGEVLLIGPGRELHNLGFVLRLGVAVDDDLVLVIRRQWRSGLRNWRVSRGWWTAQGPASARGRFASCVDRP